MRIVIALPQTLVDRIVKKYEEQERYDEPMLPHASYNAGAVAIDLQL
jgi:hypothetical protein